MIVVLEPAIDLLQRFGDFLTENKWFASGLGYVIGALVVGFLAYKAVMLSLIVVEALKAVGSIFLAGAEKQKRSNQRITAFVECTSGSFG